MNKTNGIVIERPDDICYGCPHYMKRCGKYPCKESDESPPRRPSGRVVKTTPDISNDIPF